MSDHPERRVCDLCGRRVGPDALTVTMVHSGTQDPPEPLAECQDCLDADHLAGLGLLTYKQAFTLLLRDREGESRADTADALNVSESTVDKHLAAAREKVENAVATVEWLQRDGPTCPDCGYVGPATPDGGCPECDGWDR